MFSLPWFDTLEDEKIDPTSNLAPEIADTAKLALLNLLSYTNNITFKFKQYQLIIQRFDFEFRYSILLKQIMH